MTESGERPTDKRGRQPGVPFGFETFLTDAQREQVECRKQQGWDLHFIRRPLFLKPTVVLVDRSSQETWRILENGELEPFQDLRADA